MLTFIFCICGTNLSFMYLIYHPFSGREFIAIPMASVSKAKLIWIGFIFQSSAPLSTQKKAAPTVKCRATDGCPARTLPGRISMNCNREPRGVQEVWRMSSNHLGRQTSSHGHEAADRNVSVWTLEAVANLRKTKWSNQIKPNQTKTISRDVNGFSQMYTCIWIVPFPVSKARKQTVPYSMCNNATLHT